MKLMLVCSSSCYDKVANIKEELINRGFELIMPNSYELTNEKNYEDMTQIEYLDFFKRMFKMSRNKIANVDGVLVLNYTKEKNGKKLENYIGASTFLEMYEAFMNNKKIYMMNGYPDNMLLDEIKGFNPTILNGNLDNIK